METSSELEKVEVVRKRSGAPPQIHLCHYKCAVSRDIFSIKLLTMGMCFSTERYGEVSRAVR